MSTRVTQYPTLAPLEYSAVTDADSYKWSHSAPMQYPPGATRMFSYFESRGGPFATCTLFGLQYLLHTYLSQKVTREQVEEAAAFALLQGTPFNKEGWLHIVEKHGGRLPVRIRAIPEGLVVPVSNALLTIESTDPECFWVVSHLETQLVRLWYPSTIATTSRESKKILQKYLELSSDDPAGEIGFKLHDFGGRGVSCLEQSRLGGAAHLLSFFGSDTLEGIRLANHYYDCEMAGFSIPATEHSTVTSWGRGNEYKMFEHYVEETLVKRQLPPGVPKLAACVSDSYNIYEACRAWTREPLKSKIQSSGGTLVIRPDSGDPLEVLPKIFEILAEQLGPEVRVNSKGYKVLPDYLRVIQGDGIDMQSMGALCEKLTDLKWSVSNIAFGSGGGLLQKVNRDTQKWAFKCSALQVDGKWADVRKDPATDKGKRSKAGRLDLIRTPDGEYQTVTLGPDLVAHPASVMNTVFENGDILYHTTLAECRERLAL